MRGSVGRFQRTSPRRSSSHRDHFCRVSDYGRQQPVKGLGQSVNSDIGREIDWAVGDR
jgi:hypothetical protein